MAKNNPDKCAKATAKWRSNPENYKKKLVATSTWKINNPAHTAAINANRKAAILQRTGAWTDHDKIKAIYVEAKQLSDSTGVPHHVDHVIPLQGKLCSGLHTHLNLRALPSSDNMKKGAKFEPYNERH